jgi:hypothetical protein
LAFVVDGEINRALLFGCLGPMYKYQPNAELTKMRNVMLVNLIKREKLERADLREPAGKCIQC